MSRVSTAYLLLAAQSFDLWSMAAPLVVAFIALCLLSCLAGTWLGILIADRLNRAGVARLARRRAPAEFSRARAGRERGELPSP